MKRLFILITLFISLNAFSIHKQIKVKTVKAFFEALDNDTEIIVQSKILDFTFENLEKELNIKEEYEHWTWTEKPIKRTPRSYYLSSGIVLYGYENLTIRSQEKTDIISNNSSDNILSFKNCKGITLNGFSIFHTPSTCNGSVLSILLSDNVRVKNCGLNGSGGIGANLIGANDVQFNNVEIFNNVFHAISSINSNKIEFNNCAVFDNHEWGEALIYSDISDLSFQNCNLTDNQSDAFIYSYLHITPYVSLNNCDISGNAFTFNLKDYINSSIHNTSKKDKRKTMLNLFMQFLAGSLDSDLDSRNYEFESFFTKDHTISYKNNTDLSSFFVLYYSLKKKEIKINNFKSNGRYSFTVNEGTEHPEIWTFYFNKENKLKKIKIK